MEMQATSHRGYPRERHGAEAIFGGVLESGHGGGGLAGPPDEDQEGHVALLQRHGDLLQRAREQGRAF